MLELFYDSTDEEHKAVQVWFDKNNLLVRGLFLHFACSLSKLVEVPAEQQISWAELFKLCQALGIDQRVDSAVVGSPHARSKASSSSYTPTVTKYPAPSPPLTL